MAAILAAHDEVGEAHERQPVVFIYGEGGLKDDADPGAEGVQRRLDRGLGGFRVPEVGALDLGHAPVLSSGIDSVPVQDPFLVDVPEFGSAGEHGVLGALQRLDASELLVHLAQPIELAGRGRGEVAGAGDDSCLLVDEHAALPGSMWLC